MLYFWVVSHLSGFQGIFSKIEVIAQIRSWCHQGPKTQISIKFQMTGGLRSH